MRRVWRIGKATHADTHWSGMGGLHAAARWTWQGRRVVYCAATETLAALELLTQFRNARYAPDCVIAHADIPDELPVTLIRTGDLPPGWEDPESPPDAVRDIGTAWLNSEETAIIEVPSVHAMSESNLLLNPNHPDFALIQFSRPIPYSFDRRLIQGNE